jgi:hypothetical protein
MFVDLSTWNDLSTYDALLEYRGHRAQILSCSTQLAYRFRAHGLIIATNLVFRHFVRIISIQLSWSPLAHIS